MILLKISAVPSKFDSVSTLLLPSLLPLLSLFSSPDADVQEHSLLLIAQLAANPQCCGEIRKAGGIEKVLSILSSPVTNTTIHRHTLSIIGKLCDSHEESSITILNLGGLMILMTHVTQPADTYVQIEAVRAVAAFAGSGDRIAAALLAVGGVQILVALLSSPLDQVREGAARALARLARFGVCQSSIIAAGGIVGTVSALSSHSQELQEESLTLIRLLSSNPRAHAEAIQAGALSQLVGLLTSPNEKIKALSSFILLSFARDSASNRQTILSLGGVPAFVTLLRHHDPDIKAKSAEVISIFSSEEMGRHGLRSCNGVVSLVETLRTAEDLSPLQLHCGMALLNLLKDSDKKSLETLQREGVLSQMLLLLKSKSEQIQEVACLSLSLLAHSSVCRDEMISKGAIEGVAALLGSLKLCVSATSALRVLSADRRVSLLCDTNGGEAIGRVLQLLAHPDDSVRESATHIILNACQSESHWNLFVRLGGVNALLALSTLPSAQAVAAREISRLCGNEKFRSQLQNPTAFTYVVGLLLSKNAKIEKSILSAVSVLTADPVCAKTLIQYGGSAVIASSIVTSDERTLKDCVTTLLHICSVDPLHFVTLDPFLYSKLVEILYGVTESSLIALQLLSVVTLDQRVLVPLHEAGALVASLALLGHPSVIGKVFDSGVTLVTTLAPLGLHKDPLLSHSRSFSSLSLSRLLSLAKGKRHSSDPSVTSLECVERVTLAAVSVLSENAEWCRWVMDGERGERGKEGEKKEGERERETGGEGMVDALEDHMGCGVEVYVKMALTTLCRLAAFGGESAKHSIVHSGCLSTLSHFLQADDVELQSKSAEIFSHLTTLESGRDSLSALVTVFTDVLKSRSADDVYLKVVRTLRNLFLSAACRDKFYRSGGVTMIVTLLHRTKTRELVLAIGAVLFSLTFHRECLQEMKAVDTMRVVLSFLTIDDDDLRQTFLLLSLQFLQDEEGVKVFLQCGGADVILSILSSSKSVGLTHLSLQSLMILLHSNEGLSSLPPPSSLLPLLSPSSQDDFGVRLMKAQLAAFFLV